MTKTLIITSSLAALALVGTAACDDDGSGAGLGPRFNASSGSSSPGSFSASGEGSSPGRLSADSEASSPGSGSASSGASSPGTLSADSQDSGGDAYVPGGGSSGGACNVQQKCRQVQARYEELLASFCAGDEQGCAEALAAFGPELCNSIQGELEGFAPAEVCRILDCALCVFANASASAFSGGTNPACPGGACASICSGTSVATGCGGPSGFDDSGEFDDF